jgi:hypothetical protein
MSQRRRTPYRSVPVLVDRCRSLSIAVAVDRCRSLSIAVDRSGRSNDPTELTVGNVVIVRDHAATIAASPVVERRTRSRFGRSFPRQTLARTATPFALRIRARPDGTGRRGIAESCSDLLRSGPTSATGGLHRLSLDYSFDAPWARTSAREIAASSAESSAMSMRD